MKWSLRKLVEDIEAEQARYAAIIRELYARVQSSGFDKSAVGAVVRIRAQRAKDPAAFVAENNLVNVYLAELGDAPRVVASQHVGARESYTAPENRTPTLKERATALSLHVKAKDRGEIPKDAPPPSIDEIPAFLRRHGVAAA